MDADTIARELYTLRPGEFVSARNAKATAARQAGERELAAEVKAMRRPTVSAWVTNLFALQQGARLEQLFSLGAALREAQTALSADKLRRLGEQRRQVIGALAGEAAALAATHGQPVGSQVVDEVEQTLQAALADAGAAELVKTGRLTTALSYTGFGETGGAQGAPGAGTPRRRRAAAGGGHEEADDRRREQARRAEAEAEGALAAATDASARTAQRLRDARDGRAEHARAVDELESRLTEARSVLADAVTTLAEAEERHGNAEAALDAARAALQSARDAANGH